jgi:hypothetical protein
MQCASPYEDFADSTKLCLIKECPSLDDCNRIQLSTDNSAIETCLDNGMFYITTIQFVVNLT